MTCKELITYLSSFNANEKVSLVVADIEKRLYYKIAGYQLIAETPALFLETTETGSLDEIMEEIDESEADDGREND